MKQNLPDGTDRIIAYAVANYRSLQNLCAAPGQLAVITGANGCGKSNLYRSLRLLADTAEGGIVRALAREGGLQSTLWAGPEKPGNDKRNADMEVQGGPRKKVIRLKLGFSGQAFGYAITLGLPPPSLSLFSLDPEIKRECLWSGSCFRPASLLVDRQGGVVKVRNGRGWDVVLQHLGVYDSLFDRLGDLHATPEILVIRETIRNWRFYDYFRTDPEAPARQPQLLTRTPVLHHDGRDIAAAIETIREIGDAGALDKAISLAFPGSRLAIVSQGDGRFGLEFHQHGLLRPLTGMELSDGTLRYFLMVAALLTPRPPPLMVLNEPETSLHPDLLPALAELIRAAARHSQVWVVSHSAQLIQALQVDPDCQEIMLEKQWGETRIRGQGILDGPLWYWPE